MRDLEKSALIFKACRAFEDAMGLGPFLAPPYHDPLTYFKIVHHSGPAPVPDMPPSDKDRWVFETHDDLRVLSNGGGAIPPSWAPGQSFAYEMRVYGKAVQLQDAHQDTMFIRVQDYAVRSLGGLLYLLYGARVKSQLPALLRARDPEPDMPAWRAGEDREAHIARARVWLRERQAYKARLAMYARLPGAREKLAMNARICEVLRETPEMVAAQRALWGGPDPDPALWIEITEKGAR